MSFYTALTGLNAATAQLSVTSNNIANVGTTGFKKSRADFGDIFATSPLQKAASVIGQGVSLKAVTQEFSQGNIQFSSNSLDIAITGDGFFPLKSSDGLQNIFTRNGSFMLNDSFNVVNSAGQALIAASVDSSGKADLNNLSKLIIPRKTSGDAAETTAVQLGLNFPADAPVITKAFDRNDPNTYSKTTAVTVYDAGGNDYLATVYYAKTQVATPTEPTNKWQTYVYIGDTKLQENLIQSREGGERQFVNKYGEVRKESEIPPELISRGVNKLYRLDDLKNPLSSTPATASGDPLSATINTLWAGGLDIASVIPIAGGTTAAGGIPSNPRLAFDLAVDGSDKVRIDITDLAAASKVGTKVTGIEMARYLSNKINSAFGDDRYLNLNGQLTGTPATTLMTVMVESNGSSKTLAVKVPTDAYEGGTTSQISPEKLAALIQQQVSDSADFQSLAGGSLKVDYDSVSQKFKFTTNDSSKLFSVRTDLPAKGLLGLSDSYTPISAYSQVIIANGDFRLPEKNQRFGIQVSFDEAKRTFSISSGSSGDESSVAITVPALPSLADNKNSISALLGFKTVEESKSLTPTRGVGSLPAILSGGPIGLNLDNKFRVDESNNQFVVTVDNVTGVINVPPKAEYTVEEFRDVLERQINALSDQYGRTVNGVTVAIKGTNSKYLEFTTGTTGDNSFLKVTGNSIWGLADVQSARGTTSQWLSPKQASSDAGFPLYVDRNSLETTDPGDFSESQTRDLWAPVFLTKGQLTFDTGGILQSPVEPISFKSTTIGASGATLKFSIDYGSSTQYSSPFSVAKQDQNGRPEGDLIGVDIGDNGLVSASYSNGTQKSLAKIILANFSSATGLRQIGDSNYYSTAKSGDAKFGEAGAAGFGTIRAGAQERANVDLTAELVELITAQRNFQANAKAIETNNTLTQTVINLRS